MGNEWDTEPDEVEFKYKGFNCLILRVELRESGNRGWLCGYVEILKGNMLRDVNYNDIGISVHGGLTFSGERKSTTRKYEYCLGFDCAHSGDICPGIKYYGNSRYLDGDTYKNIAYVRKELENMCDQLSKGVGVTIHKEIKKKVKCK